jgi:hypothetical protein
VLPRDRRSRVEDMKLPSAVSMAHTRRLPAAARGGRPSPCRASAFCGFPGLLHQMPSAQFQLAGIARKHALHHSRVQS